MDFVNAIILLLNYIFIPALTYGSQLALGEIFVTLFMEFYDLKTSQLVTLCILEPWQRFYLHGIFNL